MAVLPPRHGHVCRHDDEEEGEQAVHDDDDDLVSGQELHDRSAVDLPSLSQIILDSLAGSQHPYEDEVRDGVQVASSQACSFPPGFRGPLAEELEESLDQGWNERAHHQQDKSGEPVQTNEDPEAHEDGGGQRRDHVGTEHLAVLTHPLGVVTSQDDDPVTFIRSRWSGEGSSIEDVEYSGMQGSLLGAGMTT